MLFNSILVPVDFSERSLPALRVALELARDAHAASITLCHVTPPQAAAPTEQFQQLLGRIDHRDARIQIVATEGDPAARILMLAKDEPFDAIVMGTRSRMGVADYLLGSVAMRVIACAPCPVITVAPDMPIVNSGDSWVEPNRSFVD